MNIFYNDCTSQHWASVSLHVLVCTVPFTAPAFGMRKLEPYIMKCFSPFKISQPENGHLLHRIDKTNTTESILAYQGSKSMAYQHAILCQILRKTNVLFREISFLKHEIVYQFQINIRLFCFFHRSLSSFFWICSLCVQIFSKIQSFLSLNSYVL